MDCSTLCSETVVYYYDQWLYCLCLSLYALIFLINASHYKLSKTVDKCLRQRTLTKQILLFAIDFAMICNTAIIWKTSGAYVYLEYYIRDQNYEMVFMG